MPRRSPTRLTPEARARLAAEALKGVPTRDLSVQFEKSPKVVRRIRQQAELAAEVATMSNLRLTELTLVVSEPTRSALLVKMENERAAAAAEAAEERMRLLSIIEGLSRALANRG